MRKTLAGSSILILLLTCSVQALTLKDSLDLAFKNNPSIIAAQKKVEAANARLYQAVGAFFPSLKLNGSYSKISSDPQQIEVVINGVKQVFSTISPAASKSWNATLSQPILQAGLVPGLKIAQRSADAAYEEYRRASQDTAYNVTAAYFGVLSAEKLAEVADESLQLAHSHLGQVNSMVNSGVATRADLLRAEVQVANSEVALTKARNNFELAKDAYNNVLGRAIDEPVEIVTDEAPAGIPAPPDYQNLLKIAFENRPDWKEFVYNRKIAEENLNLARTAYWPTINLSGQTGGQGQDFTSFQTSYNSTNVTGTASWTLFDGMGTQNRIKEAAANLEAQSANENQFRNSVTVDVRDSFLNLKSVIETIGSAKKAVDFADENYKISSLRYSSGVGTNIEVIDAQVALNQAKTDYLNAQFGLSIAKAKLNRAVGTGVI